MYICVCVCVCVCINIWIMYIYSSWGSHSKYTGMFAIPYSSGSRFVRTSMTHLSWVALHGMTHRFIELHKPLHPKAVTLEGDQEINMRWKEFFPHRWMQRIYTEELYKKDLSEPDYYDGMVSSPEPDILEWEVKLGLRSTAANKPGGCGEIPAEPFTSLKDNATKVLHSLC